MLPKPLPNSLSKFILHFLKPYRWGAYFLVLSAFIWALDISIRPYLLKVMIDRVTNINAENLMQSLLWPACGYVFMLLLINITFRIFDYVCLKIFPAFKSDIILAATNYLEHHSYRYFQDNFSGNLSKKIMDLNGISESIVRNAVNSILPNILALFFGMFTLFHAHIYFVISILLWAIIFFIVSVFISKHTKKLSSIYAESVSELAGKITDSITNAFNVLVFFRQKYECNIIEGQLGDTVAKDRDYQRYMMFSNCFQGGSVVVLSVVLLYLLISLKEKDIITAGDFALVMTLSFSVSDAIWRLSRNVMELMTQIGIFDQALTVINQPHVIRDKEDAKELIFTKGEIKFHSVNFGYQTKDFLFKNLSVTIMPDQKVGLVGYSGSGKTTFVNLIIRLFDVTQGQILIDDQEIRSVTQKSLRENISFIPQDPQLFHRSLGENIRYGKLDASDEEVIEAAKRASAHEFIIKTAQGYDTLVGERGVKLSGGQRQRIAIARAILKNAPILILDEATSSLDSVTEHYIQTSLKDLMQGKTVLVIAHRLSTLLNMDRILVFERGKIVQDGSHEELLAKSGLYKTLWESQVGGFLPEKRGV
jgi:ATP-binding cassette subfamily B protein